MQVHPSGTQSYVVRDLPGKSPVNRAGGSEPLAEVAVLPSASHQFTELLAALRALPDVRPEIVAAVTARLAAGELDSPQAAADTAEALLRQGQADAQL